MVSASNPSLESSEPFGELSARDAEILAFERQAGLALGGYAEVATRPIGPALRRALRSWRDGRAGHSS